MLTNKGKKSIKWIVLITILALLIIWPLFRKGFWESDDGEWMVIRFSAFHESLRDGHFPVRWTQRLNHSYGYPVLNFLYPLPFYIAEIFHLLGFGFTDSIKLVFGISTILGAIGIYLFSKKWENNAGILASLVYLFAPYRIFLLYTRGSLGESVALALAPFVFLFIDKVSSKKGSASIIGLAITYAALIMSHNVIALLFTPLILLYILRKHFKKNNLLTLRSAFSALVLGLFLSAFFWIPALLDLEFTRARELSISQYSSYFLDTQELYSLVGLVPLVFIVLAGIKKNWFFFAASLITLILMHQVSLPFIQVFPIIQKIQFPWRIATVLMFTSASSAALLLNKIDVFKKFSKVIVPIAAIMLISSAFPELKTIRFVDRDEGFYTTNDDTTTVKNEFTPVWVTKDPTEKPEAPFEVTTTDGNYQILDQELRTGKYLLQIRLHEPAIISFNTHYFPGWKIYIDDEEYEFDPSTTDGLLKIETGPGRDKVRDIKLIFERTPIRKFSETLSLLTALAILATLLFRNVSKNKINKRVGLFLAIIAFFTIAFFLLSNLYSFGQVFDPIETEKAYLNSQWVNPDFATNVAIGDSGLYSWAGWQYVHGENPILINPEMPPLGKYLIGLGLLTIKRPAVIGFLFTIFALLSHFLLARFILKDKFLAIAATSLLAIEPVMNNLLNITMLDGLQLGFLNFAFLFFIKGLKKSKWFIASSLMLGAVASTKFYLGVVSIIFALTLFLVVSRNFIKLKSFLLSLPLVGLVHMASYAAFFIKGNGLRQYLGVQKWIFDFYQSGNVGTVPPGSYWLLVLFNRWRIWFGQEWGVFTTVKSKLWRITWPLNVLTIIIQSFYWLKGKLTQEFAVLLTWLLVYSVFLTFIIGWPHYMLLFLPFAYILLVQLAVSVTPKLYKRVKRWRK